MASLPRPIENLIEELIRLPGIGRRGAERLVTYLLTAPREQVASLADAINAMQTKIGRCKICGFWSEGEICPICADPMRTAEKLCVVETPTDLQAFEQSGAHRGRYHVLGGRLSPLGGVTPEDLNIDRLIERVQTDGVKEVILATSPNVEGDATAMYIAHRLAPLGVEVARIGIGIPLGASLGYADAGTLKLALEGRRKLEG